MARYRPMQPNPQELAHNADLPCAIFAFEANISTTTGAAQNIPKSGLITSDTATVGQLSGRGTSWISRFRAQFVGDAGNVAGQTINFSVIVLSAAGVTTTYANVLTTPLATTAGTKRTGAVELTPFVVNEGDLVRCVLTPSAGLTAGVTNIAVALS